jgi:type VI secretion system protein ImpF
MAKRELERAVRSSVVDRLTDAAPGTADPPLSFGESVRLFKDSVQRDLEWLLNTRRIPEPAPESMEELSQSLYNFGLPDLSALDRDSVASRKLLLRRVEEAIRLFEPRLDDIRISMSEVADGAESFRRELRFSVEATLRMDPSPERVVFDTVLNVTSGQYDVKGSRGA